MDNNELLEEDIMLMSDDDTDTDTDADTVQELSLYANNVYNEDGEKIAEIYGNKVIFEGGFITAQDTSYDNTATGLTATNVQTAIDEVTDSLTWKLLGSVTNTTQMTLPTSYNELIIKQTNTNDYHFVYHLPKVMLDNNFQHIRNGGYNSTSASQGCGIYVSATKAYQSYFYKNGTNVVADTTMTIYYR